jgi:sialidase-1
MKPTLALLAALLLAPLAAFAQNSQAKSEPVRPAFFEETVLWQNKEENAWPYHVYGLVRSAQGTLLAFAEGRRGKGGDADPHHLVVKRAAPA